MKVSSRPGDPPGDILNLRGTVVPADIGGGRRLSWQHDADPDAWFKIFLNQIEQGVTQDHEFIIYPIEGEQSFFEVIAVGSGNRFADYTHLLEELNGNKVLLAWTGSTSGDVDFYRIYNDNKTGTVDYNTIIATVDHLGAVAHSWKSDALSDGTWKWSVRAVDNATNIETNVVTVSVVIDTYPLAVSNLDFTFDDGTDKVTLTWDASPSADIDKYNIYGNGGSGFISYDTPLAVISSPTVTWLSPAIVAAGTYNYGVRAEDTGGKEEFNSDITVTVKIKDTPIEEVPTLPNAPIGLTATPVAAGKIQLDWLYDITNQEVVPSVYSVYYDNNTGVVDYVTPLDTVLHSAAGNNGRYLTFTFTTAALGDGLSYKFGVRAQSAAGNEETNVVIATAIADSTLPNAPTGLAGVETY
ncbi:hypothetical protein LCGC14_2336850 [marine sediment metagenome]|uniref:Fibronectin type-III domain-containing protein n=1 Tax=marine sediment metagenome TaxID=412755 RepID=A0A0F9CE47_9ZZZZ